MKKSILALLLTLALAAPAAAFMEGGCGAGKCSDCHSLQRKEAERLLGAFGEGIGDIREAEIPGLWVVEVKKGGRKYPIFVDYSKSFMITGDIIRLEDRENITQKHFIDANPVNVARIPVEDALLLGKAKAKKRVIVFTDPECPYCKRLHEEMREVVRRDPDIAFLIKLFPLKMHPNAYPKAKSIVCSKSLQMLEDSFADKPVPILPCEAPAVDETIRLAEELGINSTPSMIFPNGRVMPGFKDATKILELLGSKAAGQVAEK